jgi:hypothetical protein
MLTSVPSAWPFLDDLLGSRTERANTEAHCPSSIELRHQHAKATRNTPQTLSIITLWANCVQAVHLTYYAAANRFTIAQRLCCVSCVFPVQYYILSDPYRNYTTDKQKYHQTDGKTLILYRQNNSYWDTAPLLRTTQESSIRQTFHYYKVRWKLSQFSFLHLLVYLPFKVGVLSTRHKTRHNFFSFLTVTFLLR